MAETNGIYNSGNKEPFVRLEDYTVETILSLMDYCEKIDLHNISYDMNETETVYLNKYKSYWELTVKCKSKKTTDIYQIGNGKKGMIYKLSEQD